MSKFITLCLVCTLAGFAQLARAGEVSLDRLQGGWWSSCGDPAVEFLIEGSEYSGDFSGTYRLDLAGDVLTFSAGLANGHSTNVTHEPLSFRILAATGELLVLRPMPGNPYVGDWHLQSCKGMPPNNSFKPTPRRGSA